MRYPSSLRPSPFAKMCVLAAVVSTCQSAATYAGIMTLNSNGTAAGFTSLQTFADGIGSTGNDPVNGLGAFGRDC